MAQSLHTVRQALAKLLLFRAVTVLSPKEFCLAASSTCSSRLAKLRINTCWPSAVAMEAHPAHKEPPLASSTCTIRLCSRTNASMKLNSKSNVSMWRSTMRRFTIFWTPVGRPSYKLGKTKGRLFWRIAQKDTFRTTRKL